MKIGTPWGGVPTTTVLGVACEIYSNYRGWFVFCQSANKFEMRISLQQDKRKQNMFGTYGHVLDFNNILHNNYEGVVIFLSKKNMALAANQSRAWS